MADKITLADPAHRVFYKLGLIGHPVSHSLSPLMHRAALSFCRLQGSYELFDLTAPLRADEFLDVVASRHGLNVTIPHKQAVMPLLSRLTADAQTVQAVNTIRVEEDGSLIGHNTDLGGFVASLTEHATTAGSTLITGSTTTTAGSTPGSTTTTAGSTPGSTTTTGCITTGSTTADSTPTLDAYTATADSESKAPCGSNLVPQNNVLNNSEACIIGAGGAARAALCGLARMGASQIVVIARRIDQAEQMVQDFRAAAEQAQLYVPAVRTCDTTAISDETVRFDVIVNSAPIGLTDKTVPDWLITLLRSCVDHSHKAAPLLYDMVYSRSGQTLLVESATAAGLRAVDGLQMLVNQAALAFEFWTGQAVPPSVMSSALEQA